MGSIVAMKLNLTARDASGQRKFAIHNVRGDTTVQELVSGLVPRMGLPAADFDGVPQSYHAFHQRDGRHLRASETIGEALHADDEIVLHPDVQAGGAGCQGA